ncbi:ribonuclease H-like domain-containing protein [Russula compacta]|nr:ribonuclease H-like domain-containing protein [Russula compacta]
MGKRTPDAAEERAFRVPGENKSNQIGELAAVIMALQKTPHCQPLEVISNSRYVIEGLTENLRKWEDQGWICVKNAKLFKKAAHLLKRRSATTAFRWVKGHAATLGNEESDRLAKLGATLDEPEWIDLEIPIEFDLQTLAYQGIQAWQAIPLKPSTRNNLQITKAAIESIRGTKETDATIWNDLRKPVLRFRVQQFLFKSMHNAYMIGDKWNHIPNFDMRAACAICGETESMQHILTGCNSIAHHLIWNQAKEMWPHDPQDWPEITIWIILGAGSISLPEIRGGKIRLLQILISEASHLIWVLRCGRAINQENHTVQQIKN